MVLKRFVYKYVWNKVFMLFGRDLMVINLEFFLVEKVMWLDIGDILFGLLLLFVVIF